MNCIGHPFGIQDTILLDTFAGGERFAPALNQQPLNLNPSAPLIIGGLGGSGTRVVAKIFLEAGYFLGPDLNPQNDNLWFTVLFKNSAWLRENAPRNESEIYLGLRVFTKAMLGLGPLTSSELAYMLRVARQPRIDSRQAGKIGRGASPVKYAYRMWRATKRPSPTGYRGWGWKEPNSHIYLSNLYEHFPAAKYIHVVRHGLDLAFSKNQQQLYNWSFLYGLQPPESQAQEATASLKFWVRANERALDLGKKAGPERFSTVNFDRLCQSPASEIKTMLDFAGLRVSPDEFENLCQLPQPQESLGRYLTHDIRVFDPADVEAVRRFGFDVKL